ncbi:very long chain fatty acid elongase AAEL008004-like [Brevipalpus obovatus]|uniref:very long chain fatty acid elongase AAEL008004-like n=1 Tax=Brevipalpus obovatus TaxID=246614 RepID=UPI003D9E3346
MSTNLVKLINYVHYDMWQETGDPRVDSYPMLNGGPWKVLTLSCLYVLFAKYWGPKLMKGRKEWDCRRAMIVHNIILIILNGLGCVTGMLATNMGRESWTCRKLDTNDHSFKSYLLINLGYLYFITKFIDFADTLFFILRKKDSHITGLHVFHHAIMPLTAWVGCKFFPGGNSALTPLANTFVHTVMYAYYLCAAMGIRPEKYMHLKRRITEIQLIQFTLVLAHSLYSLLHPNCEWPRALAIAEGLEAVTFLKLFSEFYKRTYLSHTSKAMKSM